MTWLRVAVESVSEVSVIPTHGWACRTRTFPSRCRDCRAAVFFFSCNCGSAVLFDELGPPWPQHRCDELQRLDVKVEEYGKPIVEWAFAQRMMTRRLEVFRVEPKYGRHIVRARKRAGPELMRMEPYPRVLHRIEGVIREMTRDADVLKKLGIDAGSAGAQYVGKKFPKHAAQVTVHTGAIGEEDPESYTFFVDRAAVAEFIVQDFISVTLVGVEVPAAGVHWVAQ